MNTLMTHLRAAIGLRFEIDVPLSFGEIADRLALAAKRHESALCFALALGVCVEIWICVERTAALYPVGP